MCEENAALVILKQVLITQSAGRHALALLIKIKEIGATRMHQLSVAAFTKGTTLGCKLRLDLAHSCSPEYDILCRQVKSFAQPGSAVSRRGWLTQYLSEIRPASSFQPDAA